MTVSPFRTDEHGPDVEILSDTEATLGEELEWQQDGPLALIAPGYDAKDGELFDDAFHWRLNGPVVRDSIGSRLRKQAPPPGHYDVTLAGQDSDGNLKETGVTVFIRPKQVRHGAAPRFDGHCNDSGYRADQRQGVP